ncbi:MAG: S41 family peptidase [Planctomycetota bacterium]|nr:S41 family peptidase [Planctomycetota bacterium]
MQSRHLIGSMTTLALWLSATGVACSGSAAVPGTGASGGVQESAIPPRTAADTYEKVYTLMRNSGALESITDEEWARMDAIHRPRAQAAGTNEELRAVLEEMIGSLGKSHFALIPQEASAEYLLEEEPLPAEDAEGSGDTEILEEDTAEEAFETSDGPGDGRVGLHARLIDGQVLVTRVDPDSPAERAGIRPGWRLNSIRRLDLSRLTDRYRDQDVASMSGYQANATVNSLLTAEPGTAIPLELVDLRGEVVRREVEAVPFAGEAVRFGNLGSMEVETQVELLDEGDLAAMGIDTGRPIRVGLIRFNTWMVPIMAPIAGAVERFRDEGVDAVVIDLRGNPGGIGGLAMGVGGHFLTEPTNLGTMRNQYGELNFNTNPQTVSASGAPVTPLEVPVFVLVDAMSASTSEIFAGGMKEAGRATVVGRRTPGMALPAVAIDLPNGDVFYYAIASFTLPGGGVIEGADVTPEVDVQLSTEAFGRSTDPDLAAAIDTLKE